MNYIILDRDGVINYDSEYYIKSPEEFIFIPGSLDAIVKLTRANFKILIVTNQSGIGRGLYDHSMLELIHQKLHHTVQAAGGFITDIFFCPHHPDEGCLCRKPEPGLFLQIQKKYQLTHFSDIFFIGDTPTDMEVAFTIRCKPLLVLTGKKQYTAEEIPNLNLIPQFASLKEAVDYVLRNRDEQHEN